MGTNTFNTIRSTYGSGGMFFLSLKAGTFRMTGQTTVTDSRVYYRGGFAYVSEMNSFKIDGSNVLI